MSEFVNCWDIFIDLVKVIYVSAFIDIDFFYQKSNS